MIIRGSGGTSVQENSVFQTQQDQYTHRLMDIVNGIVCKRLTEFQNWQNTIT